MTHPILIRLTPSRLCHPPALGEAAAGDNPISFNSHWNPCRLAALAGPKIGATIQLNVNGSLLGLLHSSRAAETAAAFAEARLGTDRFRTSTSPADATVAVRLA